ncbi:hypothetical protein AWB81_02608 [Caballeronia arationis]|uniref:Uncharacterized protein n=1 Tax=Caballeronia arationis TaxID=1777142 RepID=A0A7Z7IEF6_9BURK|nr:hypothetical protein AWB81_02608 [Caballeronia arationis]SOE89165.1 hypothetical protein SAMN05446927_7831 [Caballeronia arationis]
MNAIAKDCWVHIVCAMMLCALAYAGSVPAMIDDRR